MTWRSQNSSLSRNGATSFLVEDPQIPPSGGLGNYLGHLKVGQKMTLGYVFVLGVAMLGTVLGFTIANRYQQEALHEEEDAIEELYQVHQLKSAVFRVRIQQHQLILHLEQPEVWQKKYLQLLEYVADVRQEWIEFKATFRDPSRRLKDTPPEKAAYAQLMRTKNDFDDYLNRSEILFKASNPRNLPPAAISTTQSQLFNFMHNSQVFTLDEFLDDITNLVEVTAAEYNHAKADLKKAEELELQIIAISLLLSAAIATLLVIYLNRAIARPIQMVTHVAQQVTEDANFDLQAPITTQDEIGILAASLNRLIQEVQQLLKTQKDTNEQLEVYSQILEKKVQERTQELKEKKRSLQQTLADLHRTQAQLMQTGKMSDVRQIFDEMAHGINNPVNLLCKHLTDATKDAQKLLELVALYQQHYPEPDQSIQTKVAEIDLEFLKKELPKLLSSMQTDAEQITAIITSPQHR
jgi:phosphoglycerate-specific signal transduction histidine kinase